MGYCVIIVIMENFILIVMPLWTFLKSSHFTIFLHFAHWLQKMCYENWTILTQPLMPHTWVKKEYSTNSNQVVLWFQIIFPYFCPLKLLMARKRPKQTTQTKKKAILLKTTAIVRRVHRSRLAALTGLAVAPLRLFNKSCHLKWHHILGTEPKIPVFPSQYH